MELTWIGIAVILILVFMAVRGYRRGFIRELVSFFFVFLALALTWAINPYVNDFLMTETPLYEKVQQSCADLVTSQAEGQSSGDAESNENGETDEQEETSLIESLGLPSMLSQSLESNNNQNVYTYLAVSTFGDYISGYLAKTIVNGLSFLLSYLAATIVIRLGNFLLNMIAQLPLVKGANKLTGALVGLVKGVLFVWIGFLVLTILCNTEIGKAALAMIDRDVVLNPLYKYDVFVNFFMNIFYGK